MIKKSASPRFISLCVILSFVFFCVVLSGCKKHEPADLVLMNGKILTVDELKTEATAIAVKGDTILAVGSDKEINRHITNATEVIDLQGRLAVPGLIEGHGHFTGVGQAQLTLNLMNVNNWDEIVTKVADAVQKAQPGEWIFGRGWHQEKWDTTPSPNVDGLPYHTELSKVSPDNPVILTHASGHSCIANAKAMELAGITKKTPNPEGGQIVKDPAGVPIGSFRETAQGLLRRAQSEDMARRTPEQIKEEQRRVVDLAAKECLAKGLTSFHDAGSSFETIDLFREMAESGELSIRLYVMIREGNERLKERLNEYKIIGAAGNRLTVRAIKRSIDGALGPHGAWLLEPYEDLPSSTGLNTTPPDVIRETAHLAIANGFQLCIHAIGDRANRETLDIYEEAFKAHPDKKDLRWRVEHAQHLHPDDIPRFGSLSVIASMQGIHCTSDGPYVLKRLGEKRAEEGAYVWQKLMASGAVICNGTDAPVEDVDPIACFYATATRKMKDGTPFYAGERMSREEALHSYTINCAYAAFQEDILGSLTPGKLADITVLSKDVMTVPEDEILTAEVVTTIVGGKILYRK